MRPNDFASYLLAIGICNLLLYFAFYIIMKVRGRLSRLCLLLRLWGGRRAPPARVLLRGRENLLSICR